MNLNKFIEKLEKIKQKHGGDVEVIMSDNIPVVDPVFSEEYPFGQNIIITDQE